MCFSINAVALSSIGVLVASLDLDGLPPCGEHTGLSVVSNLTGCSVNDYSCICEHKAFVETELPSIPSADCPEAATQETLRWATGLCDALGISVNPFHASPLATSTVPSRMMATVMSPSASMIFSASSFFLSSPPYLLRSIEATKTPATTDKTSEIAVKSILSTQSSRATAPLPTNNEALGIGVGCEMFVAVLPLLRMLALAI